MTTEEMLAHILFKMDAMDSKMNAMDSKMDAMQSDIKDLQQGQVAIRKEVAKTNFKLDRACNDIVSILMTVTEAVPDPVAK